MEFRTSFLRSTYTVLLYNMDKHKFLFRQYFLNWIRRVTFTSIVVLKLHKRE